MTAAPGVATVTNLKQYVDHTKLTYGEGEDREQAIRLLCDEAKTHQFFAVCVRPEMVPLAKSVLSGSDVLVATVIGFPQHKVELPQEQARPTIGHVPTAEKLAEVRQTVDNGVDELDLVINVDQLKVDVMDGTSHVLDELEAIADAAGNVPVKVIIETDLLSEAEKVQVTRWCAEAGMAMVKTSTGMVGGGQGATVADVQLIRKTLDAVPGGKSVGIKASGGIKNKAQAEALVQAGADRLGTSSGVVIVAGGTSNLDY